MGPLPTWLRKTPVIPILDLSHNKLSEPLTNLPNGGRFDVSGNIPKWVGEKTCIFDGFEVTQK